MILKSNKIGREVALASVTRWRLRGCGLRVQEAAEQRLVIKTRKCSNIRGRHCSKGLSRTYRASRFAPFLIFEALCLFTRDVPALHPTRPPGVPLYSIRHLSRKTNRESSRQVLPCWRHPSFTKRTSLTLFHHKSPNIRHR